jgi:hypothetical protein
MFTVRCCAEPPPRDAIKRMRRQQETKRIESVKRIQKLLKQTADEEFKFLKSWFPETKKKDPVDVEILEDDDINF